jgi:nucleotide-binding universal stress UspA family protein
MSNDANRPVVVGIDGSDDAHRAMRWAANEATHHGGPLRLVSAYQPLAAVYPNAEYATPVEEVRDILQTANDELTSSHPGLLVEMVDREGPAPHVLLDESQRGRMLVVGREGLGRIAELVLGSVSLAVATHAKVPVVVVPGVWEMPKVLHDRIIVGVDGSKNCQAAVEFAFRSAADRGAALDVVYAWPQPARMPQGWTVAVDGRRLREDYDKVLNRSIDGWPEKYPEVAVTTHAEVSHPAQALNHHGLAADLVVIGGRGHGLFTGMRLGSAARSILRRVEVPIAVVHWTER